MLYIRLLKQISVFKKSILALPIQEYRLPHDLIHLNFVRGQSSLVFTISVGSEDVVGSRTSLAGYYIAIIVYSKFCSEIVERWGDVTRARWSAAAAGTSAVVSSCLRKQSFPRRYSYVPVDNIKLHYNMASKGYCKCFFLFYCLTNWLTARLMVSGYRRLLISATAEALLKRCRN